VRQGALMAYESIIRTFGRVRSAVDKVLRGASPATIPFELPDGRASRQPGTARDLESNCRHPLLVRPMKSSRKLRRRSSARSSRPPFACARSRRPVVPCGDRLPVRGEGYPRRLSVRLGELVTSKTEPAIRNPRVSELRAPRSTTSRRELCAPGGGVVASHVQA